MYGIPLIVGLFGVVWFFWAWVNLYLNLFCPPPWVFPSAQDPATDPFYVPPAGFEEVRPGTILRNRKVTTSFFGISPSQVRAFQLLYRTTAVDGSAIATVTTIFRPFVTFNDRFISFHTAYDSASVSCNPSYQYQLGVPQTDLISSLEMLFIQRHVAQGYIVASPDYEGPDAALAAGRVAGMSVLDGMRAVINFQEGLRISGGNLATVGVGYSVGAIATGWAASLQSSYAPELNIKGWALGGTPVNLSGTFHQLDNSTFSGFLPAAIDGLCKPSAYGVQLQPVIDGIITSEGRELLDYANSHCVIADLGNFHHKSMFSPDIQRLGPDLLQHPTIASVLKHNRLGVNQNEVPIAPVFVYHGLQDEIIPYADVPAMVDFWCSNGATVVFTTFSDDGHARALLASIMQTSDFIQNAFAETLPEGCSRNTIPSTPKCATPVVKTSGQGELRKRRPVPVADTNR
ncbi:hypothetical protein ASPVEDRAFT_88477 [Aspergillus versicolor CBS 583.65]|uniref:Uncharacterized protein n=1 Tax=Aspergillus versicolor CBS 583.65 TaxID=1036611 RepID=A0A1L9Q0L9_ASPVE|nr:uncharacterized protein ASPVEDRAFT_88477 [Aspergillus versicolor CBS 583.65]OJJ07222.1 hypothetical protein ASPVEDRAFT_88477 [Aspergillus versicolor CBS 583.65]